MNIFRYSVFNRMKMKHQILLMMFVFTFIVVFLYSSLSYQEERRAVINGVEDKLYTAALMAKETLPADYHDKIKDQSSVSLDEFNGIVSRFNKICQSLGLEYIWSVLQIDGKIVFTSSTSPDKIMTNQKHAKFFELHSNPGAYFEALSSQVVTYQDNIDKWGRIKVVLIPFQDNLKRPYLFGAAIKLADFNMLTNHCLMKAIFLGIVFILFGACLSYLMALLITRPLTKMIVNTNRIAEGDFDKILTVGGSYEQSSFANSFNKMAMIIKEKIQGLRASQKDLEITLHSIGDAVIATDQNGLITKMNSVAEGLIEHKLSEVAGENLTDVFNIVNAFSREKVENPVDKVLRLKETVGLANHTILISKTGKEYQIADSAAPIKDDKGNITGVVLVFRDVTEDYRLQAEIKQSEETYRNLFQNAQIGLFRTKLEDATVFECNDQFAKIFGYKDKTDILNKSLDMHYVDKERRKEMLLELEENGEVKNFEAKFKKADGTVFWAEYSAKLYPEKGWLEGVLENTTLRKIAQEQLEGLRNYLGNIINFMPSVLIGVDIKGRVTLWNSKASQETGKSEEGALEKHLIDVFPRLSGYLEKIEESITKMIVLSERRQFRKEGENSIFEDITIYPFVTSCDKNAIIRIDDVSEYVKMEEIMVQSEKMLSVGGLAAGMAHEINNPLGGILQMASVVNKRLTDCELQANKDAAEKAGFSMEILNAYLQSRNILEMLTRIKELGARAAKIVINMLSFARKSDSNFYVCDVSEILDQCIDMASADYDLKKKYDFKKIAIKREYEKKLPLVKIDTAKIQQVFFNILRNGTEAMQALFDKFSHATPAFLLRVFYQPERKMVTIEIEDNGEGMEEEVRKRVFEPFFTTKNMNKGTGLGLSVSYFIISENHGGTMSVKSVKGKGTKFIISLPVYQKK